jgi:hypothetical protein
MWHEGRSPPIADFINGIGHQRKSQDVQNDFRSTWLDGHDRVDLAGPLGAISGNSAI